MPQHSSPEGEESHRVTGGRVGPPTSGVASIMYDFVRYYLLEHGESCTRDELHQALLGDPAMRERLARSRGFNALLNNMRHSGDILLSGVRISASGRTMRRFKASQWVKRRTLVRGLKIPPSSHFSS